MSELTRGSGGTSRAENEGTRATFGQVPASQSSSSGLRTPRDIMNQRQAREARRRAEAEAAAGSNTQEKPQDEESRRNTGRSVAGNVATQARDSGYRSAGVARGEKSKAPFSVTTPASATTSISLDPQADLRSTAAGVGGSSGTTHRTSNTQEQTRVQQQQQQQQALPSGPTDQPPQPLSQPNPNIATNPTSQPSRGPAVPPIIIPPSTESAQARANVSSFPHAFERWETLSSHWEGLTSYWIRRLQQNAEEIRADISLAQMSRHITDLSAAGANLFHAVVELQRLRASSERKFQRWFFETRNQQERDQDEIARLQDEVDRERQQREQTSRANFDRRISELTGSYLEVDRRNAELRRELQISKDEARRAWEELGRREQEERDRQLALREGHPIYIGGVQVQPMQGALSRGPSTREGPYQSQGSPLGVGQSEYGAYDPQQPSPTDTDPFTATQPSVRPHTVGAFQSFGPTAAGIPSDPGAPGPSQADPMSPTSRSRPPPTQSTMSPITVTSPMVSRFYQQPSTFIHQPQTSDAPSAEPWMPGAGREDPSEEELWETDDYGNVRLDEQNQPIPRRSPSGRERLAEQHAHRQGESDDGGDDNVEEDSTGTQRQEYEYQRAQAVPITSETGAQSIGRVGVAQQRPSDPADYEGTGFQPLPERLPAWEPQPQFQRSTRLSDVLEEDDEGRSLASGRRARAGSTAAGAAGASSTV